MNPLVFIGKTKEVIGDTKKNNIFNYFKRIRKHNIPMFQRSLVVIHFRISVYPELFRMTLLILDCSTHNIVEPLTFHPLHKNHRIPSKLGISAKQAELNAKLTELRRERRKLLCNEDIDEQVDAIRLTIDTIRNGPETLSSFDEILFTKLVERIVVDTQSTIRFQLYGGFEFQETLEA